MTTIKRFEDLECWKEARDLVRLVYTFTHKSNFKSDFELKNQIKRSVVSIMANIAEGFHRNSNKDFMRFLDYSRSSIAETMSHCYVALDQNYIDNNDMQKVKFQSDLVWKKLNNFINYLNNNVKNKQNL
ncbi:MAG: four helix bundle protein [Desulfobacteraceae bacterium]|nr:MAG: four helix bundle protein [Desulfobacteraceae bacterium]